MERGCIREIIETSQEDLHLLIQNERGVIRVGGTERDPNMRADEYERLGFSGIMFYAKSTNIRLAEDKSLNLAKQFGAAIHNQQEYSNLPLIDGFVYVIQGKRYQI